MVFARSEWQKLSLSLSSDLNLGKSATHLPTTFSGIILTNGAYALKRVKKYIAHVQNLIALKDTGYIGKTVLRVKKL
jgi:hypothetical protein